MVMVTPGQGGNPGLRQVGDVLQQERGIDRAERASAGDVADDGGVEQRVGGETAIEAGDDPEDERGIEAAVAAVAAGVAEVGDDVDAVLVDGGDGAAVDAHVADDQVFLGGIRSRVGHPGHQGGEVIQARRQRGGRGEGHDGQAGGRGVDGHRGAGGCVGPEVDAGDREQAGIVGDAEADAGDAGAVADGQGKAGAGGGRDDDGLAGSSGEVGDGEDPGRTRGDGEGGDVVVARGAVGVAVEQVAGRVHEAVGGGAEGDGVGVGGEDAAGLDEGDGLVAGRDDQRAGDRAGAGADER